MFRSERLFIEYKYKFVVQNVLVLLLSLIIRRIVLL